jgi:hypothetical protein
VVRFADAVVPAFFVRERAVQAYGGQAEAPAPVDPVGGARSEAPAGAPARVEPVDPFDDADALDALEHRIATLAANIHAAEHQLLVLIADYDRRRGWELGGYASCAHFLAARTRLNLNTAREKVRASRALENLPETSAAMARGELSLCAVRALSRVATPENEGELLEAARGCTVAQLERMVRAYRRSGPEDEAERERGRFRERAFSVFPDEDRMYVVRGVLPPEVAAVLMKAVEAASDALWREERERVPELLTDAERTRAAARRRADALGLIAERALQVGFGGGAAAAGGEGGACEGGGEDAQGDDGRRNDAPSDDGRRDDGRNDDNRRIGAGGDDGPRDDAGSDDGRRIDPRGRDGRRDDAPISGSRAERYQIMLHVEPGGATLDDGTRLSHETSLRLACDAAVVKIVHAPGSRPPSANGVRPAHERPRILDVGRRTRTIPPALRRALDVRDQGCRFPGCGLRFTEAHHVVHWSRGGETSIENCLLLCRHHHRLVHEEGWTVGWWGQGRPVFQDPRGGTHFDGRWRAPELPEAPVARLLEDNSRRGVRPHGWTASARWEREWDVPLPVLGRFGEAVLP